MTACRHCAGGAPCRLPQQGACCPEETVQWPFPTSCCTESSGWIRCPVTAQRLVKALNDENAGPARIAEFIEYDPAVATSVLRLANSAAFAGATRTSTVRDAVVRLGASRLLDIVLGDHLKQLKVQAPLYDLAENDLWVHSAAASLAVRALQKERPGATSRTPPRRPRSCTTSASW